MFHVRLCGKPTSSTREEHLLKNMVLLCRNWHFKSHRWESQLLCFLHTRSLSGETHNCTHSFVALCVLLVALVPGLRHPWLPHLRTLGGTVDSRDDGAAQRPPPPRWHFPMKMVACSLYITGAAVAASVRFRAYFLCPTALAQGSCPKLRLESCNARNCAKVEGLERGVELENRTDIPE